MGKSKVKTLSVRLDADAATRLNQLVLVTGRFQSHVLADVIGIGLDLAERQIEQNDDTKTSRA